MESLFGTDGIRGEANRYPITCEIALKAGQAVGAFVKKKGFQKVIIGKDTRISGDMLESAIAAGVSSTGIDAVLAGIIPTPGVAYLCSALKDAGAGVVISASHNPYIDNGIKFFTHKGEKLSQEQEKQIEHCIIHSENIPKNDTGKILSSSDSIEKYSNFLLSLFSFCKYKKRLKLIVDCSNGAASKIGHMVFSDKLFDTQFINDSPDGKNINNSCGSQYTERLRQLVVQKGADIGLAFDGDADRLIAVDEKGSEITGDRILAVCAEFAKEKGSLSKNIVVSTIMSNMGLSKAFETIGVEHVKSSVGDRNVLEKMKECSAVIGGEDSGHLIFRDCHTTGDGMLSALKLLEVMLEKKQPLSRLVSVMKVFPQVLMNVKVNESRPDFMKIAAIADTIKDIEKKLKDKGRVLVRYSGTQPMLRVMVEGPEQRTIEDYCRQICEKIKKEMPAE